MYSGLQKGLWVFGLCLAVSVATAAPFRGRVVDAQTGEPLESAQVFLPDLNIGTLSNRKGEFAISGKVTGTHRFMVTYVGYETFNVNLHFPIDTLYTVRLHATSLALDDVVVTARAVQKSGTALQINQAALEHTQPSSLADVLQFLPGQLSTDGRLDNVKQVALRQVSSDDNTALGAAVIVNGVPISNNANLNTLSADQKISERSTVNAGIDLRMLSTDHYERVELLRGIASARYGDLSSGAFVLRAKQGVTPWQVRAKVDPLSGLAYIGKGVHLPVGTLHLGGEYTYATPDEREQLERYARYSAQANWTAKTHLAAFPLSLGLRANYIGTLWTERTDPDLTLRIESYNAYYSRYQLSGESEWSVDKPWLASVRLIASYDYTEDVIRRVKNMSVHGGQGLPMSNKSGEYEGIYLPFEYLTTYSLVNKPLQGYGLLELREHWQFWSMTHAVSVGAEVRFEGNIGKGYSYDLQRPPAPGSPTSSRPRKYSDVPFYIPISAYAEDKLSASGSYGELELVAGVRAGWLRGATEGYTALRAAQLDPRINGYYAFPRFTLRELPMQFALRLGWGKQTKWPTLDQLAPTKAYFDIQSLNYYSLNEAWRLLWLTTFIEDARNLALRPSSYDKWEAGAELQLGEVRTEVTLFHESMRNGFTYATRYLPYEYNVYSVPGMPSGKPKIEDLVPQKEYALKSLGKPANSLSTLKRGIEFRIQLPKWELLGTSADVSGAYFHTTYDISEPEEYRPSIKLEGKEYPYVGIYAWSNGRRYEQLSSMARFYTHLPQLRLLFTTMVQCVWFSRSQSLPFDGRPQYYRDLYGNVNTFTDADAKDPKLIFLVREFNKEYFEPDVTPFALSVNLKVTKEIGQYVRLAFFANRLWCYLPDYRAKFNRLVTRDYTPYFGAELRISL